MPFLCYKESDHLPTILYPPLGNGRLSFKTSSLPTKKALITFKPTICKRKKLYLSPKTSTSNSTQGVVSFKKMSTEPSDERKSYYYKGLLSKTHPPQCYLGKAVSLNISNTAQRNFPILRYGTFFYDMR